MLIGNKEFDVVKNKYIMAILNVTPDSFSDGGKYNRLDFALKRAEVLISEGAHIIDVGGESTRPGYTPVSDEEEIERVAPVIEAIKRAFDIPVSLDTYKSKVAYAGIQAGADMINDIWGLKYDSYMSKVIAKANVACCIMHNRENASYTNYIEDVLADLEKSVQIAFDAGIDKEKIILDPGIGFAKNYEQNLGLISNLQVICEMGYPVLLGTSRKSVIGLTLGVPPEERAVGTVATTVIGAMKGAAFFRVHDVKENLQALKMTQTVMNGGIA